MLTEWLIASRGIMEGGCSRNLQHGKAGRDSYKVYHECHLKINLILQLFYIHSLSRSRNSRKGSLERGGMNEWRKAIGEKGKGITIPKYLLCWAVCQTSWTFFKIVTFSPLHTWAQDPLTIRSCKPHSYNVQNCSYNLPPRPALLLESCLSEGLQHLPRCSD